MDFQKFSPRSCSEEEIKFSASVRRLIDSDMDDGGTTFAGTGKVCTDTLTPNLSKADRLRKQNYW